MNNIFKKFREFISEESEEDSCPKCGEDFSKCKCEDNDYFDAKVLHHTPNGKIKKGPHKSQK